MSPKNDLISRLNRVSHCFIVNASVSASGEFASQPSPAPRWSFHSTPIHCLAPGPLPLPEPIAVVMDANCDAQAGGFDSETAMKQKPPDKQHDFPGQNSLLAQASGLS
jgi:hypothetical protein